MDHLCCLSGPLLTRLSLIRTTCIDKVYTCFCHLQSYRGEDPRLQKKSSRWREQDIKEAGEPEGKLGTVILKGKIQDVMSSLNNRDGRMHGCAI
ncbi:hypothetical protein PoB_000689200 [Plakobranchus ocellatus]|uniref:Uncharacterized protein n=1 Tax=Plakobranchus ocellatus TaxID=259542 RepID=A0AAV3YBX0_9GAST|nr:hypothetical protein PoB_000689200 [Plakobranchus ocellatus]